MALLCLLSLSVATAFAVHHHSDSDLFALEPVQEYVDSLDVPAETTTMMELDAEAETDTAAEAEAEAETEVDAEAEAEMGFASLHGVRSVGCTRPLEAQPAEIEIPQDIRWLGGNWSVPLRAAAAAI